jgi:sugar phosphate isomerase/epimerase
MDSRQDPVEMIKSFKDRLFAIHLKDFVFDRAGVPEDVVLGTGNLDLKKLLAALDDAGFDGPAIIEYEGDADDPVPATKKCVAAIRA